MIISPDDLIRRNAAFAATGALAGLPFPTSDTLQVLACVDSRVDPSDVPNWHPTYWCPDTAPAGEHNTPSPPRYPTAGYKAAAAPATTSPPPNLG